RTGAQEPVLGRDQEDQPHGEPEEVSRAPAQPGDVVAVPAAVAACCVVAPLLQLAGTVLAAPLIVLSGGGPAVFGPVVVSGAGGALLVMLVGVAALPVLGYLAGLLAAGQAALGRALLGGGSARRLRAELSEVARSRARIANAFTAERRRIERDLHDGAQQRLVNHPAAGHGPPGPAARLSRVRVGRGRPRGGQAAARRVPGVRPRHPSGDPHRPRAGS